MEIVKDIYAVTKKYPIEERYGLISQTNRATVSTPTNIADGMGRNSAKDTIQFLHISRGSAYEIETLLNIALMINILDKESFDSLNLKVEKNIKMINGLIKYFEGKL